MEKNGRNNASSAMPENCPYTYVDDGGDQRCRYLGNDNHFHLCKEEYAFDFKYDQCPLYPDNRNRLVRPPVKPVTPKKKEKNKTICLIISLAVSILLSVLIGKWWFVLTFWGIYTFLIAKEEGAQAAAMWIAIPSIGLGIVLSIFLGLKALLVCAIICASILTLFSVALSIEKRLDGHGFKWWECE